MGGSFVDANDALKEKQKGKRVVMDDKLNDKLDVARDQRLN